jgi:maltose-binding protein MalE
MHKPSLQRALCIGLALAAVLQTAGCLQREPDPIITLTWWITFAADSNEYPAFESIAKAYTEETGLQVKLVPVPWDNIAPRGEYDTQLALAQRSGSGPDIWGPVPHSWTGSFVRAGQALTLEADQIQDAYQYMDLAMQGCQFEDQQYALPVLIDTLALIYNRDLIPEPPTTFEALLELSKDIIGAQGDRWGLVFPLLSQYHAYPFMQGYGGYIFRCQEGTCDLKDIGLNHEGAVQGVQLLSDLYLREQIFPVSLADRATMEADALRLFSEGKAAMLLEGSWALPAIRASGIDYGVTAIPDLPEATGQVRALSIVQAMYASAYSTHPDEAIDLLNYVAGVDGVPHLQRALNRAPVRWDVMQLPEFRENRELLTWRAQASASVLLPNVPELGYVWLPWGQALDEAIPGLTPSQEALDRAVEEIKGYLGQDEGP